MGMEVVARPVNRSGWKLSSAVAAGGGAEPAEAVEDPRCEASARGGKAAWLTRKVTLVIPAARRRVNVA